MTRLVSPITSLSRLFVDRNFFSETFFPGKEHFLCASRFVCGIDGIDRREICTGWQGAFPPMRDARAWYAGAVSPRVFSFVPRVFSFNSIRTSRFQTNSRSRTISAPPIFLLHAVRLQIRMWLSLAEEHPSPHSGSSLQAPGLFTTSVSVPRHFMHRQQDNVQLRRRSRQRPVLPLVVRTRPSLSRSWLCSW